MKRLRFSIRTLLLIVALIAVNLAWYKRVSPYNFWTRSRGFDTGILGMLDVLTVGAWRLSGLRGQSTRLVTRFEVCGVVALMLYITCCLFIPQVIAVLILLFWVILLLTLFLPFGLMRMIYPGNFLEWLMVLIACTLPQVLLALCGVVFWPPRPKLDTNTVGLCNDSPSEPDVKQLGCNSTTTG